MPKAYVQTYGCQMNEQDSLHMKGILTKQGYDPIEDQSQADLILLVTCSIREKAVQKVYSDLGRIRPLIEANPNRLVGVAGCLAQQEKGKLFKRFPYIDLVFGPDAISNLPSMLEEATKNKSLPNPEPVLQTKFLSREDFEFVNLVAFEEEGPVKAFVNIQKGCDNVCSFCIVPHVRGREVSRPSSQIVDEVKALVDLGVQEVTLLGQNVNSYGFKNSDEVSFAGLLERIGKETKLKRLRFTTSHPKDVGPDLIRLYGEIEALCPSFHLPVQSGSNRILQAMRRFYTREEYLKIVSDLRAVRPDISLTTDLIVGFPGEEVSDFEQTLQLMEEVPFDFSFSFGYSPRPYTSAARLGDTVSNEEKSRRLEVLQVRQRQISQEIHTKLEGSIQDVLVEGTDASDLNWKGRTGTNKLMFFPKSPTTGLPVINEPERVQQRENIVLLGSPGNNSKPMSNESLTGKIVSARVVRSQPHSLIGELL